MAQDRSARRLSCARGQHWHAPSGLGCRVTANESHCMRLRSAVLLQISGFNMAQDPEREAAELCKWTALACTFLGWLQGDSE